MIKITITMPLATQLGGGELSLLHLMQQGRDIGVDWLVVFFEEGPMVEVFQSLGIRTKIVETGRLRDAGRFVRSTIALTRIFLREKPDIVLGWMTHAELYSGPAGWLAKVPTMFYQLGTPDPSNKLDRVAGLLSTHGVLTNSKGGYEAQRCITPNKPVRLIYPGVELERFDPNSLPSPADARAQLGLPVAGPIIGIIGRLQRWKGMHTLLRAMPRIINQYQDATCVVIGGEHRHEPDYPAELEKLIDDLDIRQNVVMAGLQTNVQVWMQAMDIVVHASDNEPFGIVIVEAMALGKPVIAGSNGGPSEIITHEFNGLLVDYDDHHSLSESILRYLNNPKFAKQVGRHGRNRAVQFSSRDFANNLVTAVSQIMGLESKLAKLELT